MKKILATLISVIMLFSLFSCSEYDITQDELSRPSQSDDALTESPTDSDDPSFEDIDKSPLEFSVEYGEVLNIYRLVIDYLASDYDQSASLSSACESYGITDEQEIQLFNEIFGAAIQFCAPYYKLSCGYALKDLNDDGTEELVLLNNEYTVLAIFSRSGEKAVLLGSYIPRGSCWIGQNGLLHELGSNGSDNFSNYIYRIASGGASLEPVAQFGADGHEFVGGVAQTKYYKIENGEKTYITESEYNDLCKSYGDFGGYDTNSDKTLKYSGLSFTPLFEEDEIGMELEDIYRAVFNLEIKVLDYFLRETGYLNNCKTPYLLQDISALSGLKYAYVDLDGDSRKEIIIDCGDTIILRYYQGIVYHYDFTFRQMYNLNTDASFAYTSSSGYGQRKLFFDGSVIKTNTLWEVVNEVAENTTYYLGGELSTADEITSYIAENPKTAIEFAPLEVSWQNKVSQAEALKIAEEYWKDFDIEKNFYSVALSEDSSAPQNVYVFSISRPVEGSHYSVFDTVWIDKNTAEIIIPYSDGKG